MLVWGGRCKRRLAAAAFDVVGARHADSWRSFTSRFSFSFMRPDAARISSILIDELVEDLRERWGVSYLTIFEPYARAFAPIVAQLAGT